MDPQHLQELIQREETYWWHTAKRKLVCELLHRHVPAPGQLLEGGIGAGGNLLEFQRMGYQVQGFDVMPESIEHVRSRGIAHVELHNLEEPWPVEPESLDVILMLDVLEHLEQPSLVLQHASAALKPKGKVIATVPAYPWLFGEWDRLLGHHRRYTRKMFRQQVRDAGLQVTWLKNWNSFSLPPALFIRLLQKFRSRNVTSEFPHVSPFTNSVLKTCARWERAILLRLGMPIGLSLVGVISK